MLFRSSEIIGLNIIQEILLDAPIYGILNRCDVWRLFQMKCEAGIEKTDLPMAMASPAVKKLFVGNISFKVRSGLLKKFFSKFGPVADCVIIQKHGTNKSRGIGFVEFEVSESAQYALSASESEMYLQGRVMRVQPAEEKRREIEAKQTEPLELPVPEIPDRLPEISFKESDGNSLIDILPDEILAKIFSYLAIRERMLLERVCHRWRRVSLDGWKTVKFLHFKNAFKTFRGLRDKDLKSVLVRCGSSLQTLDLSASPRLLTDWAVEIIAHQCSNLIDLDISRVAVTNSSLKVLASSCTKLKKINLSSCLDVGEKGIWWLLHSCKQLEDVNISENLRLTGQCLHMISPSVKILNLSSCSKLLDLGISKLGEKCPDLQDLNLENSFSLTDRGLISLGSSLKNLTKLCVAGSFNPEATTEFGLKKISHLHALEELDLNSNKIINDIVIEEICNGCRHLRKLNLNHCVSLTEQGLNHLVKLRHLEILEMNYLYLIGDNCLELIAVSCPLNVLMMRACSSITDTGLMALAKYSQFLHKLDVSGILELSNRSLLEFIKCYEEDLERPILDIVIGGTSMDCDSLEVPKRIEINENNYSILSYRADRQLVLDMGDDLIYENEEEIFFDDGGILIPEGGFEQLDNDDDDYGAFDDDHDILDVDDPLYMERFDLS